MRVYYDFEFLENGQIIIPISLGMVREDDQELYVIFKECLSAGEEILRHKWLMENVIPHLPLALIEEDDGISLYWNRMHPDFQHVMFGWKAREKIEEFLKAAGEYGTGLQLWADYGAYDHVRLAQMWGPMASLPDYLPMWTHDLQQEIELHGATVTDQHLIDVAEGFRKNPDFRPLVQHKAIDDARRTKIIGEHLIARRRAAFQELLRETDPV